MAPEIAQRRLRIAVVGLGAMGLPIAQHIASGGCDVRGWDTAEPRRTEAAAAGLDCAGGFAELAAWTDRLLLILRDDLQIHEFMRTSGAALPAGGTLAVMSTVDPPFMERLEADLAPRGINLVDAPILSGNDRDAAAGRLDIVVSGPEPAAVEIAGVLEACGTTTLLGNAPGAAQAAKLTCQIMQAAGIVATLEGLAYATRHGLEETALVPLLQRGSARSWALDNLERVRRMWAQPGDPFGLIHKDLLAVLNDAGSRQLRLPLTAELAEQFLRDGASPV